MGREHRKLSLCGWIRVAVVFSLFNSAAAMWPQPVEYHQGSTVLWLANEIQIRHEKGLSSQEGRGAQHVLKPPQDSGIRAVNELEWQVIQSAFTRIKNSIYEDRFVPDKFHRFGHDFDPSTDGKRVYVGDVVVTFDDPTEGPAELASDEAYTLQVAEHGTVTVHTLTHLGVLHALQTLRQLFYTHSNPEEGIYMPNAPIRIKDGPRFAHRGLNLDISRNRIYPKDVLRTIDAMAAQKLNRLHLHATDSQSWPLDIPSMPELARKGAYHKSQIWSKKHLEQVQTFGLERGIDVFIEIDMPGHTGSLVHSHPELTVAYGEQWDVYALEPPAGQLKLSNPEVQKFLTRLLDDLLPRLTSSKFHVGCDELNLNAYTLEPGLETSDRDELKPYLQSFFDHVLKILEGYNRTPVAWEEIILDWGLQLPESMIIQSWRSQKSLAEITEKGHRAIFGPASHWYLDCGFGTWADPKPGPDTKVKPPFPDWCPPFKNWRLVYSYDPLEGVPSDRHHLIIGGEAHLWGELTDSVTLDGMLWPRVAAAAEVLWCGTREVNEDATRRLAEARERLVTRGVAAGMVQMEWCLRNPGGCYL